MKKIVVITNCDQCRYFDNYYYNYNETCTLLKRVIECDRSSISVHMIPDDCPLTTADTTDYDEI